MKRYTLFVAKHRKQLFILFILMNLTAIIGITQIRLNSDFSLFTTSDSSHRQHIDMMDSLFPASEEIIFVLESPDTALTPGFVELFTGFQNFADSLDGTDFIAGPAQALALSGSKLNSDSISANDLIIFEQANQKLGKFKPLKVSNGKLYAVVTVFINSSFHKANLISLESYLKKHHAKYYAMGNHYIQYKVIDYLLIILSFLPLTALTLLLLTFRSQMKSMKATILSVIPAGIAALWTLGIMGISGDVSTTSVIAPIFTIVIGSADGLHFVSHVQDKRREGEEKLASIYKTLHIVGVPLIITTVTSIAGFMALLVMNTDAIKSLAIYASIGIALAGVATWLILPLILTGNINIQSKAGKHPKPLFKLNKVHPAITLSVIGVLIVIGVIGTLRVNHEFNQVDIFKPYTAIQKSFRKITEVNHGSLPVFAVIKSDKNILSAKNADAVLGFEQLVIDSGYAGNAVSYYDYIMMAAKNISGNDAPYPSDPISMFMITSMMQRNAGDRMDYLYNKKANAVRLIIFPADLKNARLDEIQSAGMAFSERSGLAVVITGVQYLMKDLNDNMARNQGLTLIIAFVLIFISLLISLRSFMPALLSLIPIGITVVILYGFLGWSGISLNLITATIFSIAIGVGIDYAVHYTSVWMTYKMEGHTSAEANDFAYSYTARPIITNALGLSIGLTALMLSPLTIHMHVSILMWVSMITSVFVSLALLPIMLKCLK